MLGLAGAVLGVPAGVALAHLGLDPMKGVLSDLFVAVSSASAISRADACWTHSVPKACALRWRSPHSRDSILLT